MPTVNRHQILRSENVTEEQSVKAEVYFLLLKSKSIYWELTSLIRKYIPMSRYCVRQYLFAA